MHRHFLIRHLRLVTSIIAALSATAFTVSVVAARDRAEAPRVHDYRVIPASGAVTATSAPGSHRLSHPAGQNVSLGTSDAPVSTAQQATNDSAAAAGALLRFHAALADGDSTAALLLLADDVAILESGGRETKEEFRRGHLRADMRFAQTARIERGPLRVTVMGDVAWAIGTTTSTRETDGREVKSSGAELAVLVRAPDGWKIAAVHWSSRRSTP